MIVIRVPSPLRPYTDGLKEVEVIASTVGIALNDLAHRYPGLRPHLYDEGGELRPFVNVFLNEENVRALQDQETPLNEGDRLMILPSIAGGKGI